jgi:hypothetical protein
MALLLSTDSYQGKYAVEYEDIVSGRGVVAVYKWVTHDIKEGKA